MKGEVLEKVTEVGCAAVQFKGGVEQVKESVVYAVEDGVKAASES